MKRTFPLTKLQFGGLIAGILGFLLCLVLPIPGLFFAGKVALGIFVLAAIFWMTEPVPIFATSMLVIFLQVLFLSAQGPVFQNTSLPTATPEPIEEFVWEIPAKALTAQQEILLVINNRQHITDITVLEKSNGIARITTAQELTNATIVADASSPRANYVPDSFRAFYGTLANPIIILFLGGFMLAAAAVKFKLDKNLTHYLLKPFGTKPLPILFGLMLITAVLSAFMSNTATTAMMMTVIIPIAATMDVHDRFKTALALSIPVAANIGGIATPIGTPPNAIALAALTGTGKTISFTDWMAMATPLVIILLVVSWFLLYKLFPASTNNINLSMKGAFSKKPKAIALYLIFALTVILWITENQHGISSSIVAFFPVTAFILIGILDKDDVRKLPWEVLWLVAGGISLGISMDSTGLAEWMITQIPFEQYGLMVVIILFAVLSVMMSNFLSNTVTATLLMPLAISLITSGVLGDAVSLLILGLVISVSCSLAMVLPISTPPNAIAMATGMIKTPEMAKSGVIIGIIGAIVVILFALVYWPLFVS